MSKGDTRARKAEYFVKLNALFQEHEKLFIVNVDNVGSNQMHQIRQSLRGQATVLMGKNTMVRKALRELIPENPNLEKLMPFVRGNIGFVFTNGDLKEIRKTVTANRVAAPAKANAIAPCDVKVPAGSTGMEPGKTSFFQALGIPTKITRGTIEIITEVHLIKVGNKVGASEAALLNMLNISPFTYGMSVAQVYDNGAVFDPSILDIDNEVLLDKLREGIRNITALALNIHFPAMPVVPHLLVNGYKNALAVSVATDYTFPLAEKVKAYLADPSAFAAAAPVAQAAKTEAAAAPAKAEEKEESDEDMGFGLFD